MASGSEEIEKTLSYLMTGHMFIVTCSAPLPKASGH
jgi:hypothetical protein